MEFIFCTICLDIYFLANPNSIDFILLSCYIRSCVLCCITSIFIHFFSDQRSFQGVPSSSDDIVEFPYNLGKSLFEERTLSQQSSCRWCYTIHPCLTKFSSIGGKQRVPNEISSHFDYFLWLFFSLVIIVNVRVNI